VRLLVAVVLSAALAPLNSTMVAVALPEISRTLHADSGALRAGLVTSYLLTNLVLQSPGGKLGDRIGHRRALALGQLVFAVGAAFACLWPVLPVLSAARIVMAAGGAILVPSATALLRTELPKEVRARAFGVLGAVMALAAGTGPKLGGILVGRFGWTSIFLANVPVLLLSGALAHIGAPRTPAAAAPAAPRPRFDILGSVLLGVALSGIVLGCENAHLRFAAVLGVLGFVPFVLWERRAADPVVDFSLFKRRTFMAVCLIIGFQHVALYAVFFELPQVAGRLFGVGPREVGSTLAALMAATVVASAISGRASERFGARLMVVIGCVLTLAGMVLLALRPLHALTDAIPALALLGAGLGLTSAPSQSEAMSDVPREKSGMAAGLALTMRYFGGVTGVTMLGFVLTDAPAPEVVLREHTTAVLVCCGPLIVALGCALALPRRDPARDPAKTPQ
jgi:EmrB/QacA subfamily drug resistance transporter